MNTPIIGVCRRFKGSEILKSFTEAHKFASDYNKRFHSEFPDITRDDLRTPGNILQGPTDPTFDAELEAIETFLRWFEPEALYDLSLTEAKNLCLFERDWAEVYQNKYDKLVEYAKMRIEMKDTPVVPSNNELN